ncbi:hypothetical protein NIES4106_04570 [Fischerella sp. NIES-4106]|nr:hypothetical protein NIES4106_04570 [Fischerella sp. NIES-4106]
MHNDSVYFNYFRNVNENRALLKTLRITDQGLGNKNMLVPSTITTGQ